MTDSKTFRDFLTEVCYTDKETGELVVQLDNAVNAYNRFIEQTPIDAQTFDMYDLKNNRVTTDRLFFIRKDKLLEASG